MVYFFLVLKPPRALIQHLRSFSIRGMEVELLQQRLLLRNSCKSKETLHTLDNLIQMTFCLYFLLCILLHYCHYHQCLFLALPQTSLKQPKDRSQFMLPLVTHFII